MAEARAAVAACRYPPAGIRGITVSGRGARYGRVKNYLAGADAEVCVLVQVETRESLDAIEAIAGVEGVDGYVHAGCDALAVLTEVHEQLGVAR